MTVSVGDLVGLYFLRDWLRDRGFVDLHRSVSELIEDLRKL